MDPQTAFQVIPTGHYLIVAAALFALGMLGVMIRRNALVVFMSIELMLNASNLTFLAFARERGDSTGHLSAFFIIAVAAAEAAVGLAIVISLFRSRGTVNIDEVHSMKH
jgi:NADH-quinone oxidoreductase subunit K